MSSTLRELRAAAEPYKSFPTAVAAVVQAMFDRGAQGVRIDFGRHSVGQTSHFPTISCDVLWCSHADLLCAHNCDVQDKPAWVLAYVHHSEDFSAGNGHVFTFINIGQGDGVNKRQDRSCKRLVRDLANHLSPSEALHTVIIDEAGETRQLGKDLPGTVANGFRVDWPKNLIGFGRGGLTLKFGLVRVPITTFLARSQLPPQDRERLNILTHPWVNGVVELHAPDPELLRIPISTMPASNFDEEFYLGGYPATFMSPLLEIVRVVLQEMNKMVMTDLGDFCNGDGELVLDRNTYKLTCTDEMNLWRVEHVALAGYKRPWEPRYEISLNITFPIFRTIGPDRDEIMLVIWWQLAMWIQFHDNEIFAGEPDAQVRTNMIYLALRRENSERSWDE